MREQIKHKFFIGFIEDNNDPKKLGRCKIRIPTIFDDGIPTEDIPWASPWKDLNGNEFNAPEVGKVVSVIFNNNNIYKPEFIYAEHYNINLENKLKSLSEDDYKSFKAIHFDHSTQIYRTKSEGLKIDHEYSNLNLTDEGDINLNLRDNDSKVNLGSEDASQAALLGTAFLNWFDDFVEELMGTPYTGNMGAPVVVSPTLMTKLIEYQTSRDPKFLSKNVWLVDNNEVKEQDRDYEDQEGDDWNSTTIENNLSKKNPTPYKPKARGETGRPEFTNSKVPKDITEDTIASEANIKTVDVSNYENGKIPTEKMKKNKNLSKDMKGDSTYLMADASDALDAMINDFNNSTFDGKQTIIFTDGYRSYNRQVALYNKYGAGRAAKPGTSNHGWGIAVDMYWGVRTKMNKQVDKRQSAFKHPMYKWFSENGPKYGWYNPAKLRDDRGTDEWWHWEYHGKPNQPVTIVSRYNGEFTKDDISNIKSAGGSYS